MGFFAKLLVALDLLKKIVVVAISLKVLGAVAETPEIKISLSDGSKYFVKAVVRKG